MGAAAVDRYLAELSDRLQATLGSDLVGVYVHGSLTLGDFAAGRSDVDVLVVAGRSLTDAEVAEIGARLGQEALPAPAAAGLELSLVTRESLAELSEAPPFELHLATDPGGCERVVDGRNREGDTDLVMHYGVLREHGHAVLGPPPRELFPVVPRRALLESFLGELDWAEEAAPTSYQVLNACRARRYAEGGVLCSKTAGGEWAVSRVRDATVVVAALAHRRGRNLEQPDPESTRLLLDEVRAILRAHGA